MKLKNIKVGNKYWLKSLDELKEQYSYLHHEDDSYEFAKFLIEQSEVDTLGAIVEVEAVDCNHFHHPVKARGIVFRIHRKQLRKIRKEGLL